MPRDARVRGAVVAGAAVLLAGGCGTDAQDEAAADLPEEITCEAQYRPDAERAEGQERATVTVARSEEPMGEQDGAEFATMALRVTYTGDAPEGRVFDAAVTGSDGRELALHRYQFGEPPPQDIGFAGGHGFTGLAYISHDGAQVQYWCGASVG